MKIQRKYLWSTIVIILGVLLVISGAFQGIQGKPSVNSSIGGWLLIFGGILYKCKKHRLFGGSKYLMIFEIFAWIAIGLFTFLGMLKGYWFLYPLPFMFFPLGIIIAYVILCKGTKIDR